MFQHESDDKIQTRHHPHPLVMHATHKLWKQDCLRLVPQPLWMFSLVQLKILDLSKASWRTTLYGQIIEPTPKWVFVLFIGFDKQSSLMDSVWVPSVIPRDFKEGSHLCSYCETEEKCGLDTDTGAFFIDQSTWQFLLFSFSNYFLFVYFFWVEEDEENPGLIYIICR